MSWMFVVLGWCSGRIVVGPASWISPDRRAFVAGFDRFFLPYLAAEAILVAVRHGKLSAAVIPDRTLHHALQPGVLSEVYTAEFQYLQQVNSLGMRGAEIAIDRTAGVCRVLMLGDSFTMGTGVADDETFTVLLQNSRWNLLPHSGGSQV
ncbi:MAG: hypothetical protein ACKO3T_24690 [Planctomycetaceae bacterium]